MWAALRLRAQKRKAEDGEPTPSAVLHLLLCCCVATAVLWQLQLMPMVEVSQPRPVSDTDYRAACIGSAFRASCGRLTI